MIQKPGFTTGTLSGDLNAKFGASRRVDAKLVSLFLTGFLGLQFVAIVLAVVLAVPLTFWAAAFLAENPYFLGELMARLQSIVN